LFGHDIAGEDDELILVVRFELLRGYAQGLIGPGLSTLSAFAQEQGLLLFRRADRQDPKED
jgi:hypothetical protein